MKILIIEDDKSLAETMRDKLKEYHTVDIAFNAKDGITQTQINNYDLITLDIALPDMSGVEACKLIRTGNITAPILMITGIDNIKDKVEALDAGADDYLIKPFHFDELMARVRALLRRTPESKTNGQLTVGDLTLDPKTRTVTRGDSVIHLRKKEFDLLEYLMSNVNHVMTRNMIIEHVWDGNDDPFTNVVDVHIKYLRDHIDKPFKSNLIKTVHGVGYKIQAEK